jgi:hypothetical protein
MMGVGFPAGEEIFLLLIMSRPALWSTQPPIEWILVVLSPRVKQEGRETNHSPPSSAEAKNGGAVPPFTDMSSWHGA